MELINERKFTNENGGKRDLLSNLVNANEEVLDDGEQRLGEGELLGEWLPLNPVTRLFTGPPLREYFHFLPCWIRGEDILAITGGHLILILRQTSGHTLSFALNMLAVHQEEQEVLYQHIQEILPDGRLPVSTEDYYCSKYQARLHF